MAYTAVRALVTKNNPAVISSTFEYTVVFPVRKPWITQESNNATKPQVRK
jgi:hypothetical protein